MPNLVEIMKIRVCKMSLIKPHLMPSSVKQIIFAYKFLNECVYTKNENNIFIDNTTKININNN